MKNTISKLPTGIAGFDQISNGGLPKGRTTLVSGTSGSAKTIFACQFLAEGVLQSNEKGVFVTFEETPDDIKRNMRNFNWDIDQWEKEGKWAFVDISPIEGESITIAGDYDLGALLIRIEHAIKKIGATRLVMDSLGSILTQFDNIRTVRKELLRISYVIKKLNVTAVMTSERVDEYGHIARFGVEEFVADNVIILRNVLEAEKRRRTIEILKYRGTTHQEGEVSFTIVPNQGIVLIYLSASELKHSSSARRISSGNKELDEICNGGFFKNSIILASGPTGTGKTLLSTTFLASGIKNGERCIGFAYEESREQLFRNANNWGIDFEQMEKEGKLLLLCDYPEITSLEKHIVKIIEIIRDFKPDRISIDSLSALERISTINNFREFIITLTSFIKQQEITGLFTSTTPSLMGGTSITEAHISTITDAIILLRYVEALSEMRRGITVIKMRGSIHDKRIREFTIDNNGIHIGKAFKNISGILSGNITHSPQEDLERLDNLFQK